jgi:hypothetical protein
MSLLYFFNSLITKNQLLPSPWFFFSDYRKEEDKNTEYAIDKTE